MWMKFIYIGYIYFVISMTILLNGHCEVLLIPKDTEVGLNETSSLVCESNAKTFVRWKHCAVDGRTCTNINYGNLINQVYSGRYTVDPECSSTGRCHLTIRLVQVQDAGEYCCVDADGRGENRCAKLTVVTDIVCSNNATDGVVRGTSCGIPSDVIQHKCGIKYQGSTPPIIRWLDLEGNFLEHSVQSQMNSTGVMESTILQTSISWASRNGVRCQLLYSKRSCLSRYESHYAFNSTTNLTVLEGSVSGIANSSVPCSYAWYHTHDREFCQNSSHLLFSSDSISRGEYRCLANCPIKYRPCYIEVLTVYHIKELPDFADNVDVGISVIYFSNIGLIIGFICGLLTSSLIAWFQGSNIQRFLKPCGYHMTLLCSFEKERNPAGHISRFTPAYNYMECIAMRIVKLTCQAESILDVAKFEDDILSVSGRGTNIYRSPCPNVNFDRSRMWNGIISCFCCKPNAQDFLAANVPRNIIRHPWSMAVDSFNRHVYVSGYQNDTVCRIPLHTIGTDVASITKWSVFGGQKPAAVQVSLSMENNGNIIAVSLEVNWLEEYNSNGELVRKIELQNSDDYAHIQHAIKKSDGRYVFGHGWKEDKYHRVCLVDKNGELLASYGNSKGDAVGENGQLNTPTNLAMDENNFVLVADYNNHRIILLDPVLKFVKVLITPEAGLYRPCRLHLDERQANELRLCVGEDRKDPRARIMIFFLKRREAFNYLSESEPLNAVRLYTVE